MDDGFISLNISPVKDNWVGGWGGWPVFWNFYKKKYFFLARARGFCKKTPPPPPHHPLRSERTVVGFYSFILHKFLNITIFQAKYPVFSISHNHFPWKPKLSHQGANDGSWQWFLIPLLVFSRMSPAVSFIPLNIIPVKNEKSRKNEKPEALWD